MSSSEAFITKPTAPPASKASINWLFEILGATFRMRSTGISGHWSKSGTLFS